MQITNTKTSEGNRVWKISEVESLPHQYILYKLISIAKIGKILVVENEIVASISFLSFFDREMVKLPGLGTDLGQ